MSKCTPLVAHCWLVERTGNLVMPENADHIVKRCQPVPIDEHAFDSI